jgi:hypothetical protein
MINKSYRGSTYVIFKLNGMYKFEVFKSGKSKHSGKAQSEKQAELFCRMHIDYDGLKH